MPGQNAIATTASPGSDEAAFEAQLLSDNRAFDACLQCLIAPALSSVEKGLGELSGLASAERDALLAAAAESLTETVRRKVSRVLVLELNAARVSGSLRSESSAARWAEFLERAGRMDFWLSLTGRYPTLLSRLAVLISGRVSGAYELGRRFAHSRADLAALAGAGDLELTSVRFGAGDSHRSGRTVAILELGANAVVYKPRSLAIDRVLESFLSDLFQAPPAERIRVPAVLNCGSYGWSEFVGHSYCLTTEELHTFYHRLGHWLALAGLFGTTDLHAENVIAAGPTPVVVDCETIFTPLRAFKPLGAGAAIDRAAAMLTGTVLTSGLLPNRGLALAWRGVDISAAGSLPGQQPMMRAHQIVDAGTDQARLDMRATPESRSTSLPAPKPDLATYWPDVLAGYDELTERLTEMDTRGRLDGPFAAFGDVDVRAVLRSTEAYTELSRMLWHPVSLHDEPAAVARATVVLRAHSDEHPAAPSAQDVIDAEVKCLLVGDIPYFQTTPAAGWLRGPATNTQWGEPHDVLADALTRWRSVDRPVERELIRASVACAYLNDGYLPADARMPVQVETDHVVARRQHLAATVLTKLSDLAIHGGDGTVTWTAPVLNPTGWSVQPLSLDLYSGLPGVVLLLSGYLQEMAAGRALPVAGLTDLLAEALASMRAADDYRIARRQLIENGRPDVPGLYLGLGSQIWCWTALAHLGVVEVAEADQRALALAALLPESLEAAEASELLKGRAGGIIALLGLADRTGDSRWLDLAVATGDRLLELADTAAGCSRWPAPLWPAGIGGFAHGATGIGWALARLGETAGRLDFTAAADAAFAFEETLWSPARRNWRDIRYDSEVGCAWCHGAVGIGLAAADLLKRGIAGSTDHAAIVRRAAEACLRDGLGHNHTVCHGDLGSWELLTIAADLGLAPAGFEPMELAGHIVSSIEQHGLVAGLIRSAFVPGLMPGAGGIAYQLLRMDPASALPSVLLLN